MQGYYVSYGYKGFVNGRWMLFATEDEYVEYVRETERRRLAKDYSKML